MVSRRAPEDLPQESGRQRAKGSVGEEAAMEDYYLNFRKGVYQVTCPDMIPKRTLDWLLRMARLVAERISASLSSISRIETVL